MNVEPTPANPELLLTVKDFVYEEIFNEANPPEHSTTLEGTKNHQLWEKHQHLLESLTPGDFQVLVERRLDGVLEINRCYSKPGMQI